MRYFEPEPESKIDLTPPEPNVNPPPIRLLENILVTLLLLMVVSTGTASPLPSQPHIYVEGSASIEVEPDEMFFSVALTETAESLAMAKEVVDRRSFQLIELSKKMGIANKDITTTTLRVSPSYTYVDDERVPNGVTVSRSVDVHLRDLSGYPDMMEALVEADISKTISTRLMVSNSKVVEDEALADALKDAKQRALRLARLQGLVLGTAYSISEFATRGEERYSLYVSRNTVGHSARLHSDVMPMVRAPREPFEPGVMVARAQVYVVYLLK